MTSILIRKALHDDLFLLNNLMFLSKSYWGYDESFMNAFMDHFGLTSEYLAEGRTYLVQKDDKDIGFYSFSFSDKELELDNFFLHPSNIGIGLGRIIWKLLIETARSYNVEFFILWTDPNAIGFYEKMGCLKIGERPSPLMPNRYPSIMKYTL